MSSQVAATWTQGWLDTAIKHHQPGSTHAVPGGCRKRKSRPEFGTSDKSVWGSSEGWKTFDVTDELLMGAEEGGFAGLEVLDDVSLLDSG